MTLTAGEGAGAWCADYATQDDAAAVGLVDGSIVVWRTDPHVSSTPPGLAQRLVGVSHRIIDLAFAHDSQQVAACTLGGPAYVWNMRNQDPQLTLDPGQQTVGRISIRNDDRMLILSGDGERFGMHAWELPSGRSLSDRGTNTMHGAFGPGNTFAVGTFAGQGQVVLVDSNTLSFQPLAKPATNWVRVVDFSPDGQQLAGCHDTFISIWDVSTGSETHRLSGHANPIQDISFSPNGEMLASAGHDGIVIVWDVASGKQRHAFNHHYRNCANIGWSYDGRHIAVGGRGPKYARVVLWNTDTGQEVFVLQQSGPPLAFSDDGRYLAALGDENTVNLWEVSSLVGQRQVRSAATR